ncbi:hypothetical protein AB0M64_31630 [Streptomyces sp. NPDC051771]
MPSTAGYPDFIDHQLGPATGAWAGHDTIGALTRSPGPRADGTTY